MVCTLFAVAPVLTAQAQDQAVSDKSVMFILDASNSMWGRIDGRAKFDIAKDVLGNMIGGLPKGTQTGLISYGHRFSHKLRRCDDIELISPYGDHTADRFSSLLNRLQPGGQTPIAATLRKSAPWVATATAKKPTVVLITDGIESCDGDPCAAARKLASRGIEATVHVVGYDLKAQQRSEVECIARNGNGKYFDARDASGLKAALVEVREELAKAPKPDPAAQKSSRELYFEDDFNGNKLAPHWTVKNKDEERYLVEHGELLMVGSGVQLFKEAGAVNIIKLGKSLPTGDWDINLDLKMKMQTGYDILELGLYRDDKNFLSAQYYRFNGQLCRKIELSMFKRSKGKDTNAGKLVSSDSGHCGGKINNDVQAIIASNINDGVRLTYSKRGREYFASVTLKGVLRDGAAQKITTDRLTSLRSPGEVAITTGTYDKRARGEVLSYIDRIEIVSLTN